VVNGLRYWQVDGTLTLLENRKKPEVRKMLDAKRAARREAAVPPVQFTLCWANGIIIIFVLYTSELVSPILFCMIQRLVRLQYQIFTA
jgi:hypothetical protein